jgi:hypothetical protein
MLSEQKVREMLDKLEEDNRLTEYSVARVQVNAPLALEQVSLHAKANLLRDILGLPRRRYHGRDEDVQMKEQEPEATTTVLNAPVDVLDLDEAYCPNCGPNHALSNGGVDRRDGPARCDVCEWEGTNGDLLDLLDSLNSED